MIDGASRPHSSRRAAPSIHPSIHIRTYSSVFISFSQVCVQSCDGIMHPIGPSLFIGPQKKKSVFHGESDHEDDAGPLMFWYIVIFPFPSYQSFLLLLFPQIFFFFRLLLLLSLKRAENRLCSDHLLYHWESLKQTPREHNSLRVI